jgi:hypothetical protein
MTACRKAGVPGLLLHDLRRSAVRNLERAGVSRSVAMKLTGHKTGNVYRRYAIVAENDLREDGIKLAILQEGVRSVTVFRDSSVTPRRWHSLSGGNNGGLGRD